MLYLYSDQSTEVLLERTGSRSQIAESTPHPIPGVEMDESRVDSMNTNEKDSIMKKKPQTILTHVLFSCYTYILYILYKFCD